MIKWKRSGLHKGERVRIQENLLITNNGNRLEKAEYVDETEHGIRLRFFFEPGPCTEDTKWWYDTFISWLSIHCGDVKLATYDGRFIKAERLIL